jgi:hypothetical protein
VDGGGGRIGSEQRGGDKADGEGATDDVDQVQGAAILANWRGEAPVRKSISNVPQIEKFRVNAWLA